MTEYKDANEAWIKFWFGVFDRHNELTADGKPTFEAVKNELADYHMLLSTVPLVYDEITGGQISKPNTKKEAVIEYANLRTENMTREALDELEDWGDVGRINGHIVFDLKDWNAFLAEYRPFDWKE